MNRRIGEIKDKTLKAVKYVMPCMLSLENDCGLSSQEWRKSYHLYTQDKKVESTSYPFFLQARAVPVSAGVILGDCYSQALTET